MQERTGPISTINLSKRYGAKIKENGGSYYDWEITFTGQQLTHMLRELYRIDVDPAPVVPRTSIPRGHVPLPTSKAHAEEMLAQGKAMVLLATNFLEGQGTI